MTSGTAPTNGYRSRVYLAGPEVFLPNALELGDKKKRICSEYGFDGVFPLDQTLSQQGLSKTEAAFAIADICVDLMDGCDLGIANMTPFRSVSMDVGTAIELGYMAAAGTLVFGYTNVDDHYMVRVAASGSDDGYEVEDFDLCDNLMCEGVIRRSGGEVVRHAAKPSDLFTDMTGFEACVRKAAELLAG
ncbi:MAG: nucleoside 2-deoxyribosyltransferase [Acidimicrobiales bacterium]